MSLDLNCIDCSLPTLYTTTSPHPLSNMEDVSDASSTGQYPGERHEASMVKVKPTICFLGVLDTS
jgi:hypothetical protein